MPKAAARKPPGAKESFGVPSSVLKCGGFVLILAVIIGISHVLSPKPDEAGTVEANPKGKVTAVTQLDNVSFDSFIAANPNGALVDFFTKSCKFCAKLAPEYESAAQQLRVKGGPPLASLDADIAPDLMKKYEIQRFPTVLWFWKGENVLELPRAAEKPAAKIVEWAQWATTPAVQDLETRAEFEEALPLLRKSVHKKHRLMVAFNRADFEGFRSAFESAAQRYRVTSVFLFIQEASMEGPLLKAYGHEASQDKEYQSGASAEEIHQWVKSIVEEAKVKDLEDKVEEKKAKVAPLEQTLEILQAKKSENDLNTDTAEAA